MYAQDHGKHGTKKLLALPAPPIAPAKRRLAGKKMTKEEKMKQLRE